MKKVKWFLSLASEEAWINTIQAAGYRLTGVNSVLHRYTFEKLTVEAAFNPMTRLDVRSNCLSRTDFLSYTTLFADDGWQLIKGSRWGGRQYFQQQRVTANDEIFSDEQSRKQSQQRDMMNCVVYGCVFLAYFFMSQQSLTGSIFRIKDWYLTPGLWQMQGTHFWRALLFETPFALLRGIPVYTFLILGIYYLMRAAMANAHQESDV